MKQLHPHLSLLEKCIEIEEKEESNRYKLDQKHTLKSLKNEGLAIHPIKIIKKTFGYADYPEISFRVPFFTDIGQFRDGVAIECFCGQENVKGVLISLDGKQGEFRLFAPDFPDWLDEDGVGIKRSPDLRTTSLMKQALRDLPKQESLFALFLSIHDEKKNTTKNEIDFSTINLVFKNKSLNESQQQAVKAVMANEQMTILHGPPGTGKTTTLIESIFQLIKKEEKVIVSAPSNTAVDNIAKGLVKQGIKILRVGNYSKIDEALLPFTPEGKLSDKKIQKEIKELKKRAEEFRKMALSYKRKFGKAEREQRSLLFKEVKNIRAEIKKTLSYHEEKQYAQAQVILGTPIGLLDSHLTKIEFSTLIIDEAGQCLEPLAWCIFPLAKKIVLAGDPFQLPPTVLSIHAEKLGFNKSILEVCFTNISSVFLLNTQYRMRQSIADFSSSYFYDNQLLTPPFLQNIDTHIIFYDTAGAGYEEKQGANGSSLMNEGELEVAINIMNTENIINENCVFISPYSGQVVLAKEKFVNSIRVSTIDSFQGQEYHTVIVSLVRSNENGIIGFLNDVRRMNVALTRAKEKLIVIGDSATLGKHIFYKQFFAYIEKIDAYKSVWELIEK